MTEARREDATRAFVEAPGERIAEGRPARAGRGQIELTVTNL
jgi:hypothetical protein